MAVRALAVIAWLGACSSPGGDPVDAPPAPPDAGDDAPAADAAVDAAPDAAMIECDDLDVGPAASFDEIVDSPRQGDQTSIAMAWRGSFAQLTWKEAGAIWTIRNSVTATYLQPARKVATAGAVTALACQQTSECLIALRDPVGFVRVDSGSVVVDASPITNAAFREIGAVGAAMSQYLIVYRDEATSAWFVQRYRTIGGQPLDAVPRRLPPLATGTPVVAGCDATGCLLAYPGATAESGRFRVPWVGAVPAVAPPPGPWERVVCNPAGCLWAASGGGFLTDLDGGNPAPIALPVGKLQALAATASDYQLVVQSTVTPSEWSAYRVSAAGQLTLQGLLPGATWVDADVGCDTSLCTVFAQAPSLATAGEHDVGIVRVEGTVMEAHLKPVPGANAQTDPRAASNGTVQVVAWIDRRGDEARWRFARRDANGWLDAEGRALPVADDVPPTEASLTWTGHDFLFAWIGLEPTRALRAVRISVAGTVDAAPRELVAGAQRHALACSQDVCLAVTTEPGAGGAEHRVRRLDATTLAPLGGATTLRGGVDLSPVLAAASGDRFAVAGKAAGGANQLTRVALDGALLDSPAVAVPDQQLHALVGRDGGFVLATSAVTGGGGSLRFVGATVGSRVALPPEATAPVLASLGADVGVAWKYPDNLVARRYDATGPRGITRVVGDATASTAALAAAAGGEVLAAWSENDPAPDVAARRLRVRRICGH